MVAGQGEQPNGEALRRAGWRAVPGGVEAPDGQRLTDRDLVALWPDGSRSMDLREGLLAVGSWVRRSLQDSERSAQ